MTTIAEFRSDTFTLPDDAMRKVIYEAEVGNSAYGEDPGVRALEEALTEYFDREAALFFPSATMAGQAAIAVWCRPAEQVIIEEYGHNYHFEAGSMAMISATQARPLVGRYGILESEQLAAAALYAMQHNVERLLVDHDNAQFLARELAALNGLSIDLESVQTNMVYVDVDAGVSHAIELVAHLQQQGVQAWNIGPRLRFVTSMLVERRDCERAVKALSEALKTQ